jgi:hypothetical protein
VQLPTIMLRRLLTILAAGFAVASLSAGAVADAPAAQLRLRFPNGLLVHSATNQARVPIAGRLVLNGRGVAGAPVVIAVIMTVGAAGPAVPVGTVTTDRHGHFGFDVPPGGAREVLAIADGIVSNKLVIELGTRIHLTAGPRVVRPRQATTFTGQIVGLTETMVLVQIQVRKNPGSYQTFLVLHSHTDGSFRGRFRFGSDRAHFVFRALVVPQAGFPYARSESNLTAVTVR